MKNQLAMVVHCGLLLVSLDSFGQSKTKVPTAHPHNNGSCTHLTPLKPGIPGSPTNLIQLPNREPGVSQLAWLMRKILEDLGAQKKIFDTTAF